MLRPVSGVRLTLELVKKSEVICRRPSARSAQADSRYGVSKSVVE
jgi:hypothetical protein